MNDVHSIVSVTPEDIVIRIAVQTIECGIFILHYIANTGRLLLIHGVFNDLLFITN